MLGLFLIILNCNRLRWIRWFSKTTQPSSPSEVPLLHRPISDLHRRLQSWMSPASRLLPLLKPELHRWQWRPHLPFPFRELLHQRCQCQSVSPPWDPLLKDSSQLLPRSPPEDLLLVQPWWWLLQVLLPLALSPPPVSSTTFRICRTKPPWEEALQLCSLAVWPHQVVSPLSHLVPPLSQWETTLTPSSVLAEEEMSRWWLPTKSLLWPQRVSSLLTALMTSTSSMLPRKLALIFHTPAKLVPAALALVWLNPVPSTTPTNLSSMKTRWQKDSSLPASHTQLPMSPSRLTRKMNSSET